MAALEEGRSAALVSDAGTPVLSDPGFPLVREARLEGRRIVSVPGPSAFTAALAASGQPALPALLAGFLPPRRAARRRRLAELAGWPHTVVVLLSPHRLADELEDVSEALGGHRSATLLAEISKRHERALMADLASLAGCDEAASPRGEYVLVVGPAPSSTGEGEEATAAEVGAAYRRATEQGLDRREALQRVAEELGLRRREVYDLLLEDRAEDA
jgi:16S rRNA (cytidine1402-2'-O)-methyltransferase